MTAKLNMVHKSTEKQVRIFQTHIKCKFMENRQNNCYRPTSSTVSFIHLIFLHT